MRPIHTLVWHCTATPEGREHTVEDIRRMHRARGFTDIGYHRLVHLDGRVSQGRPDDVVGAHVAGHNTGSLGFAYIGGTDASGRAKDTRTAAQREAMIRLTRETLARHPTIRTIVGHRDLSPDLDGDGQVEPHEWTKMCPCFDAQAEYSPLLAAPAAPAGLPSRAELSVIQALAGSLATGARPPGGLPVPLTVPSRDAAYAIQGLANLLGAGLAVDGDYGRLTRAAVTRLVG